MNFGYPAHQRASNTKFLGSGIKGWFCLIWSSPPATGKQKVSTAQEVIVQQHGRRSCTIKCRGSSRALQGAVIEQESEGTGHWTLFP